MADKQKILQLLEMLMNQKKKKYIPSAEFTLGVFAYEVLGEIFILGAFQPLIYVQCVCF